MLEKRSCRLFLMCVLCQVSALCCAGGEQNLILLDRTTHKPNPTGTVGWAGSTFGPLHKSRIGEHEFEALMRTLDNLVGNSYVKVKHIIKHNTNNIFHFRRFSQDLVDL